jgi:acetylornithine/N-succinyldiaminopimelate aminotransferase
MNEYLLDIYNKLPITLSHGEGIWLYDDQDNQYLDALSGIGVTALGHNHPTITKVLSEQVKKLIHVANPFFTQEQSQLAKKLCQLTGLAKAYFSNSGAEANEAAIKMALKYGIDKGYKSPKIIVMEGGFHGRSLGAWSGSCDQNTSIFGPLIPAFIRVPFDDLSAITQACRDNSEVVAIMLEPIFGKGGLLPASIDYLNTLRKLCDENDYLLIFDEVQSGMGRTGKLFAYQFSDIKPDILTTAKALGAGIPAGAFITNQKASGIFSPGDHGSTQGGNALACKMGLTLLDILESDNLYENIEEIGNYLSEKLTNALSDFPLFDKIQGKGLMIGIKLKSATKGIVKIGLKHKIIFNQAGEKVIRLLPPYIITREDADLIVDRITNCFKEL